MFTENFVSMYVVRNHVLLLYKRVPIYSFFATAIQFLIILIQRFLIDWTIQWMDVLMFFIARRVSDTTSDATYQFNLGNKFSCYVVQYGLLHFATIQEWNVI